MPKIRCTGCETVINAPDKARGKVIACPKCNTRVKVPAGRAKAGAATKKPESSADLGALDLNRLHEEHGTGGICPYCAAEMDEEDPVCRSCGMNVETGQMDPREKRRRAARGPDTSAYWKGVWKESWQFLMENKSLALRTGVYWALFATLNATCAYLAFVFTERLPPKVFWIGMTIVTGLGIPGWFLFLGLTIIRSTVLREQVRGDRIYFDFFQAAAAGTRMVFWPLIVMGPALPLFVAFLLMTMVGSIFNASLLAVAGLGALLFGLIPLLMLPLALIHMTAKYTYKAWILWELLKIFAKNAAPTIYILVISALVFLPVVGVAAGVFFFLQAGNPFQSERVIELTGKITLWIMEVTGLGSDPKSMYYYLIKGPLNIVAAAIILTPIALIAGFPAVFLMRAIGLTGYYFNHSMDLVQRITPGTPATFWVRYLAHTIDMLFIPLTSFLVTANRKTLMVQWVLNSAGMLIFAFSPHMLPIFGLVWPLYTAWMYWAVQESSEMRSTLGKDAFGLMVTTENDRTMTLKQATAKWGLRSLWYYCGGIPFLWAAFHPQKRSLHDLVTRSKVVWKGDR